MLLLLAATAVAVILTAQPVHVDPAPFAGTWIVEYLDAELGPVQGRARVSSDEGSARVTLRHPRTGAEHVLRSSSVRRDGAQLTIALDRPIPVQHGDLERLPAGCLTLLHSGTNPASTLARLDPAVVVEPGYGEWQRTPAVSEAGFGLAVCPDVARAAGLRDLKPVGQALLARTGAALPTALAKVLRVVGGM